MERFFELIIIFFVLYVIYALSLGRWDYTSHAKRQAERAELKEKGLSSRFFFTSPYKLFILNFFSGGLFLFYWFYKQWSRVETGYKTAKGAGLRFPVWIYILFGLLSLFELAAIVNRTASYMRKKTGFPALFWGFFFLLAFAGIFAANTAAASLTSFIIFIAIPCIIQNRINTLVEQPLTLRPQGAEIVVTVLSAGLWVTAFLLFKQSL